MSVQVADEAAVVRRAVFLAWPRSAFVRCAGVQCGAVKGIDRCLVRGEETHVRAVADAGRPAIDGRVQPELRVFTTPGLRAGVGEDARTTQRGQHCVVKGHGLVEAVAAEGYVGKDAGVLVGHGNVLSGNETA